MDRKKKSVLRFLKKRENSPIVQPLPPLSSVTELSEWYHSINNLPLNKFIDVAVDSNLFALVKSGVPSLEQLANAWENIKYEYADAVGDHEHVTYMKMLKEITVLQINLQQIHLLIDTLRQVYYEPFCDRLNKLVGTAINFANLSKDEYLKQLQGCHNRSKAFKIDLDLKLLQFKAIDEKNNTEGVGYTRDYFLSILIVISNYAKYPILDSITVSEFCKRMKMYADYCKSFEKK